MEVIRIEMEPLGTKLQHIARLHTSGGQVFKRQEMVDYVSRNPRTVYVKGGGSTAYLEAILHHTPQYVKSRADGTREDNLLYLPGGPLHGR